MPSVLQSRAHHPAGVVTPAPVRTLGHGSRCFVRVYGFTADRSTLQQQNAFVSVGRTTPAAIDNNIATAELTNDHKKMASSRNEASHCSNVRLTEIDEVQLDTNGNPLRPFDD